jgi:hypothetical protein
MPAHGPAYSRGLWQRKLALNGLEGRLDNFALVAFFGFALFSLLPVDWEDGNTARGHVTCMMGSVVISAVHDDAMT